MQYVMVRCLYHRPIVVLYIFFLLCIDPRPPRYFLRQCFSPNKLGQALLCNCFYTYYASFYAYEVKFGGVVWVWGSSKIMVEEGLVKSHDCYFVHFINILQDICSRLAM